MTLDDILFGNNKEKKPWQTYETNKNTEHPKNHFKKPIIIASWKKSPSLLKAKLPVNPPASSGPKGGWFSDQRRECRGGVFRPRPFHAIKGMAFSQHFPRRFALMRHWHFRRFGTGASRVSWRTFHVDTLFFKKKWVRILRVVGYMMNFQAFGGTW